ncbi:MAG TPA: VOC family protein [Solirubrobacteraceae bacterium]|jgi:catechol 2,3-dioxygenase-like lactoylglutathione lyase family enzyme
MRLRVARHTDRLAATVSFYRDRVGLREIGRFTDHDGYDGVFLEIPGADAELELTSGGGLAAPPPHPESLLVLYCTDEAERAALAARIAEPPVTPENPYWRVHGIAFADPDGFQLILALR